jgi:gas vesicle structural protein
MAAQGGYLSRPSPSGLAEVIDTILDRGIVIDVYARVSVVGIELLTVDARIVVSSADTYLRFAEATNRLDLEEVGGERVPEILERGVHDAVEAVASHVVEHKIEGAVDKVGDAITDTVDTVKGKAADVAETIADKVEDVVTPGHSEAEES